MRFKFQMYVMNNYYCNFIYIDKVTGVAVSIFPLLGIGAVIYGRYVKKLSKNYLDELAKSTAFAQERLSNIRTVRLFSAEKKESNNYDDKIEHVFKYGRKEGRG